MDMTLDAGTAQTSHGKWWVLMFGATLLFLGGTGPLMGDRVSLEVRIAAGCVMALSLGLMLLARSRLPSLRSRQVLIDRLEADPELVLDSSYPKITFAMACAGAAMIAIFVFSFVLRWAFDRDHRPDGVLRACSSIGVFLVGMHLIMWSWMRPWDTTVKRLVNA